MHRLCVALFCVTVLGAVAGCSGNSSLPNEPPQPQSWRIQAGGESEAQAYQSFAYDPSTLTIDSGDTVTWSYPADEPHTVSLLPAGSTTLPSAADPNNAKPAGGTTYDGTAFTSSGFKLGGGTYSLRFTKPGTYKVYCLIHQPEMQLTIVVQQRGAAYPESQAAYDAAAASGLASDFAAAAASLTAFPYTAGSLHLGAGIAPGLATGKPANSTVLRFLATSELAATTTVPVGSTVTWTNLSNNAPHTVTFGPLGAPFPQLSPFSPPSGGNVYDGTKLVNSGPLFPGQSFAVTFSAAGTYQYECLFHGGSENMVSTLIVR